MSIRAENLGKRFGGVWAVRNLSLRVEPGEIVGLLGPNGAGKSTTIRMLAGVLRPTEGRAYVNEQPVDSRNHQWRNGVGYLPEHNPLYLDLFVLEYLQYVGHLYRAKRADIERAIGLTDLGDVLHKQVRALSKGYRQRLGLAAALLPNPHTLILDEPTAGLDPNQLADIRSTIRAVSREVAILLSTHIMQEVEAVCARVAIISGGKLLLNAPAASLSASLGKEITRVEFAEAPDTLPFKGWIADGVWAHQQGNVWEVTTPKGVDPRGELFRHAAEAGAVLVTLQRVEPPLEELFHQLTVAHHANG